MSGAIRRSHESKKRVRSATAFGQCNRNRLLRQSKVLFAHLTPGPLMGVSDLLCRVDRRKLNGPCLSAEWAQGSSTKLRYVAAGEPAAKLCIKRFAHPAGDSNGESKFAMVNFTGLTGLRSQRYFYKICKREYFAFSFTIT